MKIIYKCEKGIDRPTINKYDFDFEEGEIKEITDPVKAAKMLTCAYFFEAENVKEVKVKKAKAKVKKAKVVKAA